MPAILIIGGGLAGLFTALKLAPLPCMVLTPTPLGEGASSAWAQGGIAAAIGVGDSIASHVADTLSAGAGLCDAAMVEGMARDANARIHDLLALGVPFDRDLEGHLIQSREAAHSASRIVRVRGDMAGRKIMEALIAAVHKTTSIRVLEGVEARALLRDDHGAITGVEAVKAGRRLRIMARHVVLATGGAGQLYSLTTNPKEAWGSGLAMAYQAGASLVNMEFVQFHPTALAIGRDPAPLATEALRGEGATLIDAKGQRFMPGLHPDAELAPRDVVARGVFIAAQNGGAFLDCRLAIGARFKEAFPTVYQSCISAGIDPISQPIPVAPAAHYHMGGVKTDAAGRVEGVSGLYAVGEVTQSGVHGANRLASNSLLEAVVFGARVADALRDVAPVGFATLEDSGALAAEPDDAAAILGLRQRMQRDVGVMRAGAALKVAAQDFAGAAEAEASRKLRAMARLMRLMAEAALARDESRGGHARRDAPNLWPEPLWSVISHAEGLHFMPLPKASV